MEDEPGPPKWDKKMGRKEMILTALRVAVLLTELVRVFLSH
jgi:hypothetical protein